MYEGPKPPSNYAYCVKEKGHVALMCVWERTLMAHEFAWVVSHMFWAFLICTSNLLFPPAKVQRRKTC